MPCEISLTQRPRLIDNDVVQTGIELIRTELNKAGFTGLFSAQPIEQIRMRGDSRFRVQLHKHPFVIVHIKTGNNATAWRWGIRPPHPISVEHCYKLLKDHNPDPPEPDHTTKPRFLMDHAVQPVTTSAEQPAETREPALLKLPSTDMSPSDTSIGPSIYKSEIAPAALPNSDVNPLAQLVTQLTAAKARAELYAARAARIADLKASIDKHELLLLTAQDERDKKTEQLKTSYAAKIKTLEAELEIKLAGVNKQLAEVQKSTQQQYEDEKVEYDDLRTTHVNDSRGAEAVQFVQTLKSLGQ